MRCQTFSFSFFPCSADHERDWPPCKVVFFGLATNALNVTNNNNNNNVPVPAPDPVPISVPAPDSDSAPVRSFPSLEPVTPSVRCACTDTVPCEWTCRVPAIATSCMPRCVYVFNKLHITAQSGPVILLIVILCHSHVCVCVCVLTLTNRALTIPSNIRRCQSGRLSAEMVKIRGTCTKL